MNECLKHIIELNNEHTEAMKVMHIAQTAANEASKDLKNAQNRVVKLTQERTAWLSEKSRPLTTWTLAPSLRVGSGPGSHAPP